MTYNNDSHYASWAPYSSNIKEHEIGLSRVVAESLNLKEGSMVKCCLVTDCPEITSVTATAVTKNDWEMLEMTSNRIQSTILDQTTVIYEGQLLPIWINSSIHIILKLNKLSSGSSYGRMRENTEISIAPYSTDKLRRSSSSTKNYRLSHCQSVMINPTTKIEALPEIKMSENPFLRQLNEMTKILQKEAPKSYEFRVIKGPWEKGQQLTDLTLNQSKHLEHLMNNQIFTINSRADKEYLVRVTFLKGAQSNVSPGMF